MACDQARGDGSITARFNGAGYFDNPHFWVPIAEGSQGLDHWADRGNAWSAGWRVQDQGRRVAIEWVMSRPCKFQLRVKAT